MNGYGRRILALGYMAMGIVVAAGTSCGRCYSEDSILGPSYATIRMPEKGVPALGFTTQVQIANENAAGYIPVKIIFNAVGTLPADRHLVYRFATSPGGQTPPRNGLTVDVPISAAQGAKSQTFIRYLPKWSAGQSIEVSVLEDGRALRDYVAFFGTPLRRGRGAKRDLLGIEREINWVFISSGDAISPQTMPDLRSIVPTKYASNGVIGASGATQADDPLYWSQVMFGPHLLAIGQNDLPNDWRAYQRYDAIVIDTEGLHRLRANSRAFQAVRSWVLNGGIIIIYDAEAPEPVLNVLNFGWTRDAEAAETIRLITSEINERIDASEESLKDEAARLRKYLVHLRAQAVSAFENSRPPNSYGDPDIVDMQIRFAGNVDAEQALKVIEGRLEQFAKGRSGENAQDPIYNTTQWGKQIWMQSAGAGTVVGILQSDQYEVPPLTHWQIVAQTIDYRASPMLRRGVDPLIGDRRFANWVIPGVAEPPVYTFMGLLTAFVVLVGPVAYRKTAKVGRSYLMFAIAPVLALVTTLAMFGYGIMSDGFGTVVRARQLTWVDGKSGDAGERVRATYFAGVRPEGGLRFPGNAEVIGYPEGVGHSWEDLDRLSPATIGKVSIRADSQEFDSSFLPSRQQRQFVVHAPRTNVGGIRLIPDPDAIMPPNVDSTFDFLLREAVMRGNNGAYWFVENLAAGQGASCRSLSLKEASKILGRMYTDHRPLSRVRETRKKHRYGNDTFDVLVDAYRSLGAKNAVTDGVFEQWLRLHLQTSGEIPRNHFVAIADASADVVAVEGAERVESVRYVFGTLR
jgi:hypothetical protein